VIVQLLHACVLFICLIHVSLRAKTEGPEKIGNFLVSTSQQAGPLFGFGQNVIDQYDKQMFANYLRIKGKERDLSIIVPGFLYGISDDLSVFLLVPYTLSSQEGHRCSRGIRDSFIQIEYAFINKIDRTSATQATIIGNVAFPTGSAKKVPRTGFGAPSFFLAGTLSYMDLWWAAWIQGGAILPMKHNEIKFGNQFLYQTGFEYCFATYKGWIFAWLVEGFGIYEQKDKLCGTEDRNSGGNTFWIGPSLWISSQKIVFQLGVAVPVIQHLRGSQSKNHYFIDLNFGYTF
jgi:hypothetical protein